MIDRVLGIFSAENMYTEMEPNWLRKSVHNPTEMEHTFQFPWFCNRVHATLLTCSWYCHVQNFEYNTFSVQNFEYNTFSVQKFEYNTFSACLVSEFKFTFSYFEHYYTLFHTFSLIYIFQKTLNNNSQTTSPNTPKLKMELIFLLCKL